MIGFYPLEPSKAAVVPGSSKPQYQNTSGTGALFLGFTNIILDSTSGGELFPEIVLPLSVCFYDVNIRKNLCNYDERNRAARATAGMVLESGGKASLG